MDLHIYALLKAMLYGFRFVGEFEPGKHYKKNSVVTTGMTTYISKRHTSSPDLESENDWHIFLDFRHIQENFDELIDELRRLVKESQELLDELSSYEHVGTWKENEKYNRNKEVLYKGSTYRSLIDYNDKTPNNDGTNWQLIASRGDKGGESVLSVNKVLPDDKGDVHLTLADLGIENYLDLPLATEDQAKHGTGNESLMTPLRTRQAIEYYIKNFGTNVTDLPHIPEGTTSNADELGKLLAISPRRKHSTVKDYPEGDGTVLTASTGEDKYKFQMLVDSDLNLHVRTVSPQREGGTPKWTAWRNYGESTAPMIATDFDEGREDVVASAKLTKELHEMFKEIDRSSIKSVSGVKPDASGNVPLTKKEVGLENTPNYGIATLDDVIKKVNNKLMTPWSTYTSINRLTGSGKNVAESTTHTDSRFILSTRIREKGSEEYFIQTMYDDEDRMFQFAIPYKDTTKGLLVRHRKQSETKYSDWEEIVGSGGGGGVFEDDEKNSGSVPRVFTKGITLTSTSTTGNKWRDGTPFVATFKHEGENEMLQILFPQGKYTESEQKKFYHRPSMIFRKDGQGMLFTRLASTDDLNELSDKELDSSAEKVASSRRVSVLENKLAKGTVMNIEQDNVETLNNFGTAFGRETKATKFGALATGKETEATGQSSLATGENSIASGWVSVAMGRSAKATSNSSIAIGKGAKSTHSNSVALGDNAKTDGMSEVALTNKVRIGNSKLSSGDLAVGVGVHCSTPNSTGVGKNGKTNSSVLFFVGDGNNAGSPRQAFEVKSNGNAHVRNNITSGGADYAEMFEWADGNVDEEDRVGLFVSYDSGEKIRLANAGDEIVGIISGSPSVIGDEPNEWQGRHVKDPFGRVVMQEVDGELVEMENPYYSPDDEYKPRMDRKEWDAVGMVGKLFVRDDGSCEVDGYATVGKDGIATKAPGRGLDCFRVVSRVSKNVNGKEGIVKVVMR